ncbi:MAG: hypothetical protein Q4D20_01425 [Clostridia bacterium]|nr:hypothetical protein [Clostridia bacterium]
MKTVSVLKRIKAVFISVIAAVCMVISPMPNSEGEVKIVSQNQYVLSGAFVAGQGLCNDGEFYYTSGAISKLYMTALSKIDMKTGETVKKNLSALPRKFTKEGYDHIGAISLLGDTIYAPVEHRSNENPLVLLFDKNTLEYTGKYFALDSTYLYDGIPWCAVDSDNNLLYTSPFHTAKYILAFNLSDMSFAKKIDLSSEIDRVQGGVYHDGKLYVNLDPLDPKNVKTVKTVDLSSGNVAECFSRTVTGIFGCETEGITLTFTPEGKMRFVIADYDKTVCVFLRTYEIN